MQQPRILKIVRDRVSSIGMLPGRIDVQCTMPKTVLALLLDHSTSLTLLPSI
jgi:hypothetical protein